MTTLYLSGRMRGESDCGFALFDAVAASLRAQEFGVISPVEHDRLAKPSEECDEHFEDMIGWDFAQIVSPNCDGIVLLPDWEFSQGARAERLVCETIGKPVYTVHQCATDPTFWALASDVEQKRLTVALRDGLMAALAGEVA